MSDNPKPVILRFDITGTDKASAEIAQVTQSVEQLDKTYADAAATLKREISPNVRTGGGSLGVSKEIAEKGTRDVGDLAGGIGALSQVIPNANSALAQATQNFDTASSVLSAASGAIGGLTLASGALLAVVGALAVGFTLLQREKEKQLKQDEQEIDSLTLRYNLAQQYITLAKEVDRTRLQSLQDNKEAELRLNEQIAERRVKQLEDEKARIEGMSFQADENANFFLQGLEAIGNAGQSVNEKLFSNVDDLNKKLDAAQDALEKTRLELELLTSAELERAAILNETVNALQREYDLRRQLAGEIQNLTAQEVQDRIENARAVIEVNKQEQEALVSQLATTAQQIGDTSVQSALDSTRFLAESMGETLAENTDYLLSLLKFKDVDPSLQGLVDRLAELQTSSEELANSIAIYEQEVSPLVTVLEAQRRVTGDLANEAEDFAQKAQQAQQELSQVNERIGNIQAELAEIARADTVQQTRSAIEAAYQARIDEAKAAEQQAEQTRRLAEIRRETLEREREIISRLNQAQQDAFNELNKQVAEENTAYMQAQLEALADYQKQERRINEDFARDRLRFLEDLNDNLADAALDNDVKRFIQLEKAGEKELRRQAEDFSTEEQRRAEDFADEQKQAREQHEQRLKDLTAQYNEERIERYRAAQEQLRDLRRQLTERLLQEQEAGRRSLTQSQILEQQLANLRNQWRIADEQTRRNIRIQGLQKELTDQIAHQERLRQVVAVSFSRIMSDVARIAGGARVSSSTSSTSGRTGGNQNYPQLNYNPANQSLTTTSPKSGGGVVVPITISQANFGAIATPDDIKDAVTMLSENIVKGITVYASEALG